jgi:hypothetical protein
MVSHTVVPPDSMYVVTPVLLPGSQKQLMHAFCVSSQSDGHVVEHALGRWESGEVLYCMAVDQSLRQRMR